jgi:hypothetical protein
MSKQIQVMGVFSFILLSIMILTGCGGGTTGGYEYAKWNFSGYIVDGSTNERIPEASITYLDEQGIQIVVNSDASGAFFIGSIPYGQKTFRISCTRLLTNTDTLFYTERLISASSVTESNAMEGVVANGSRVIKLYPLKGEFSGEIFLRAKGTGKYVAAKKATVSLQYRDTTYVNSTPESFYATTDSTGTYRFTRLPADTNLVMSINGYAFNGSRYVGAPVALPRLLSGHPLQIGRTILEVDSLSENQELVATSNVLDQDGLGLMNVSPQIVPYFLLLQKLDSKNIDVQVHHDTTNITVVPEVRGDTVFLNHSENFPSGAVLSVQITGVDPTGKRVQISLTGSQSFKTSKGVVAIASNLWRSSPEYKQEFSLFDTLWIRFSEKLNENVNLVQWSKPTATKALYGKGLNANAKAWIHGDTLFVRPDQRFDAASGDAVGLMVSVVGATGIISSAVELSSVLANNQYMVKWTNTKDMQGKVREDMRSTDSIVVVASRAIGKVVSVGSVEGATLPPGILPSDISVVGDTIVYKPRMSMAPGVLYGFDFDVQGVDGNLYYGALPVKWKTAFQVKIISVNNRDGAGYRRFKSIGDSLVVQFSKAINIDPSSIRTFTVNMIDVKGTAVQTQVSWDKNRTTATIHNITPLPLADYGITTTTGTASVNAKAVNTVTFDLVTADGEVAQGLNPDADTIKIFAEEGLCAVNSNVLKTHAAAYEIVATETARENFPLDTSVVITFNRVLDTAYMKQSTLSSFASIETGLGATMSADVSFTADGKSLVIHPQVPLATGEYWIKLKKIPGLGIRDAAAISKHGGTFTGASTTSNYLLKNGFQAK